MLKDSQHRFVLISSVVVLLLMGIATLALGKGPDVLLINGAHHPGLDVLMPVFTHAGDGLIFLPFILVALFLRFGHAAILTSAWALHGVLSSFFKRVVFPGYQRPSVLLDNELLYFVPGVDVHSSFSFPSGHTATAFCLATVLALIARKKFATVLLFVAALVVAWSRIYLLQHFMIDTLGGAAIGIVAAWICWWVMAQARPSWYDSNLTTVFRTRSRRSSSENMK